MKIRKLIICTVAILMTFGSAFAQKVSKSDERYEFNPFGYIQFQDGLTYTFGEASTAFKLMSNIFSVGGGYDFNPYFAIRANAAYGQNRGYAMESGRGFDANIWQFQGDAMINATNLLFGYRHDRTVSVYPFIGFVGNIGVENSGALNMVLPAAWEPASFFPAGHAGVHFDVRLTDRVSATLEGNYMMTKDSFNSKIENRPDQQVNVLAGLKLRLGKSHTASKAYLASQAAAREAAIAAERAAAEKAAAEAEEARIAAEKAAAEKAAAEAEAARIAAEKAAAALHQQNCVEHSCNIFFALDRSYIRTQEMKKVDDLANFLNENPEYKVALCGYADRNTGTPRYNLPLSERRVKAVKKALMERGIAEDRIFTDFKGDTVQPFELPEQNRLVICNVQ